MAASFSGTGGPSAPPNDQLPTYAEAASCPTTYPAYIQSGPATVGIEPAIYVINGRHECVAVVDGGFVEEMHRRRRIRMYVALTICLLSLTISLGIIIPLCVR